MARRILPEDIETVRERARIDDVVSAHVTLKPGGVGSLKGLCPFHDEKTPSFSVNPARGLYYCFGCGAGGDAVKFVQEINNLTFREAIELLADKYGVQLRYDDQGPEQRGPAGPSRVRLLEANAAAAEFYARALLTPDARPARDLLAQRQFTRDQAQEFGVGYAPRDGRALATHLRARGYTAEELVAAGLIRSNGGWDYFQGRLLWPIKDAGDAVLGFGARRLFDDDHMPAKYINTPETTLYKKSHVLYGLDRARVPIGKRGQAVVVEGYTDVMACHIAGVDTAVAACGTAFGDDHARLLQRLLGGDAFHGEIIFTFDGDAAGQKAALRVFSGDQNFASQTYVAVEPGGRDPCDLRIDEGDAAVRELVGRREPLYRFVMRNVVSRFDLDRVDGRLGAVREAAKLVTSIRDKSLVEGYVRELATMVGLERSEVQQIVRQAASRPRASDQEAAQPPRQARTADPVLPDPGDRRLSVERDTLKLMLQRPELFTGVQAWNGVAEEDFTHPAYRRVFAAVDRAFTEGGLRGGDWARRVVTQLAADDLKRLAIQLSVEPLLLEPLPSHADEYAAKLRLLTVTRVIATLKSRMQRTNPQTHPEDYEAMFAQMIDLEVRRKDLLRATFGE